VQYTSGNVTATPGSQIITGAGTLWLTNVLPGYCFKLQDENAIYAIASVDSDTQIHLTANYSGAGGSGKSYQICVDFTISFGLGEVWAGDRDWQFHLTVNTIRALDTLLNYRLQSKLSKSVAGNQDITLGAAEYANAILEFTGALTGSINVIVPLTPPRQWTVFNNTTGAFSLTVKPPTGSGVAITQGKRAIVYVNGVDVVRVTADT
jgi:hypothetical protein